MSSPIDVTPELLRDWPLPEAGESKYGRGQLVVVGGALRSPGAAMLSGIGALRVGAGRLTLAVGRTVAPHVAVAVPECGVVPLDETPDGSVSGFGLAAAKDDLLRADVVLLGPGLDEADEAQVMVRELHRFVTDDAVIVLDAFGLGVVPNLPDLPAQFGGRLVLTPNKTEAALLLERDLDDLESDIAEIGRRYNAVVTCFGVVADPEGRVWRIEAHEPGLGTSGSGDVLAGAIAGLCARGATPAQATVIATHVHLEAGRRLGARIAPLGYLASELLAELPAVLAETGA
jgi:ADP-dependent NAD(P)H-hydrate dehydratase